jgi:hypothetical protein
MQIVSVRTGVPSTVSLHERTRAGELRVVARGTIERSTDAVATADALRAALPGLQRGATVVVAIGGDAIRSRRVSTPTVPDDELPDLVRMQVERDANAGSVIDFVPLAPESGRSAVLACWCDAAVIDHWRSVATQLGGKPGVVTARAIADAEAIASAVPTEGTTLAVTRSGDELDFVLLDQGRPAFVRSARITPGEGSSAGGPLLELRRTLLAAEGVTRSGVERTIAHDGALDRVDVASLGETRVVRVERSPDALEQAIAGGVRPTIDLAAPRRAKPPAKDWRLRGLLAGAAASGLVAATWGAYAKIAALDSQIASAEARRASAQSGADEFAPYRQQVEAIDRWLATDVTWLDELDRLVTRLRPVGVKSEEFPRESDAKLVQLVATARVEGDQPGGVLSLQAAAANPTMAALEGRLRDAVHPVEPLSTAESNAPDAYRYQYRAAIRTPAYDPFAPVTDEGSIEDQSPDQTSEGAKP